MFLKMYKGLAGGYGKIFARGKMTFVIRAQKKLHARHCRCMEQLWLEIGLACVGVSGDELILTEHLLDFFESGGHLFFGMCCHEREADEGVLRSDCG